MIRVLLLYPAGIIASLTMYWNMPPYYRKIFLAAAGFLVVSAFSLPHGLLTALACALVFAAGRAVNAHKDNELLLPAALTLLTALFVYLKLASGELTLLSRGYNYGATAFPIGASFFFFRSVHYLADIRRGEIKSTNPAAFAAYIFFLPTYLAGPLERYQTFNSQTAPDGSFNISFLNYGLFRILSGLIKKTLIADKLADFALPVLKNPELYSPPQLLAAVYALTAIIIFDFTAYCDIAIGFASFFGYNITENFRKPWLAENPADLFRRWHITLYSWLRDYIFFPFAGRKSTTLKLYAGIILTFSVSIMWHSLSAGFFIALCLYAAGVIFWLLYQKIQKHNHLIRKFRPPKVLSIFFTLSLISAGLLFIFTGAAQGLKIIKYICYIL